jgi:hypothetical protein
MNFCKRKANVTMISMKAGLVSLCAILAAHQTVAAADAYYHLPVASLTLTQGSWPANTEGVDWRHWQKAAAMQPYAVLNGDGEAYLAGYASVPWEAAGDRSRERTISLRAPENKEVTGQLFVPKNDFSGMVQLAFKVSAAEPKPEAKQKFLEARESYYRQLLDRNIPGAAWFRHQADVAAKERGTNAPRTTGPQTRFNRFNESDLENTFDLFTGGRALSENLQLDRALPAAGAAGESVAITNLSGITVQEMNWKPLLKDPKPELDPLTACIPADQHALLFPSFQAMTEMIDEADANGTPVLQLLEPRSEDANSRDRYQKQLRLGLSEISRLLGPRLVSSVAFTGSDPFLRVGTDVAVLFETGNPQLLRTHIFAQQTAARAANTEVKSVNSDIEGVACSGVVSPDRSVSSYVAAVTNIVVVSNSRKQLENLVRAAQGKVPALSSQDEYVFFRQRYPRNDKTETAFLVLSDAAIRRWCGPQWRIADSRRTRVAAAMSELQAAHLDELAQGKIPDEALRSEFHLPDVGELRLMRAGVVSSTYGSLNFMTPISEIPLTHVSRVEADAYQRWRDSYQRNWRQFFDPIAVRFSLSKQKLSAELTVMPLIAATDYRRFIDFTAGAQIAPGAGDPHTNALLRLAVAINAKSQPVQEAGNFVGNMAPGLKANPFAWLGQSITLYADEDPFWDQFRASTNAEAFLEDSYPKLPVALHCEVKNSLGVATFLTALRAFMDQTAPQMTSWQNLEHNGRAYVKVTQSQKSADPDAKDWAVYYAVTPDSLTVTLNESLLKRALDRQSARATDKQQTISGVKPWLGTNLCLQVEQKFFDVLQKAMRDEYQTRLQLLAWNNLPVLNEWKRLYPDKDPAKLHEALWGTRLLCPGGGTYAWNEKWHTMESTVFGHPGEPRTGSANPLSAITAGNLGVSFENQGLSAKAVLDRNAGK